ncbi:hypothetical protein ACFQZE_16390 [Paenibacillus sp. GCM10027627]|uniref:hypothetical protein n=1 Tax=unclassified Paenibacillus TaxID=185978 RepID=UPI0036355211
MDKIEHSCAINGSKRFMKRYLTFFLLLPLLITASFAYQAGNNFELTAGSGKITSSGTALHVQSGPGKHPSETKALLPNSPDILAVTSSLLVIYLLAICDSYFRTPHRQGLRDRIVNVMKYTSNYVDEYRKQSFGKLEKDATRRTNLL